MFIVNSEYRFEYISENVTEALKYRPEELQGDSIFNYIHLGDHRNISSILVPMIRAPYGKWGFAYLDFAGKKMFASKRGSNIFGLVNVAP